MIWRSIADWLFSIEEFLFYHDPKVRNTEKTQKRMKKKRTKEKKKKDKREFFRKIQ